MTMDSLPGVAMKWGLAAVFVCWAATIAYGLLVGRINTGGLLRERADGSFSPARVQLLVSTLVVLGAYVQKIASFKYGQSLPDMDNAALGIFGVSHAVHLSSKTYQAYMTNSGQSAAKPRV